MLGGCRSAPLPPPDADAILQEIHHQILRGNLELAAKEIDRQRNSFPGSCADCAERFRLAEAELLNEQGHSADIVSLLCKTDASPLKNLDSVIREKMFCGVAHFTLGQQKIADSELPEAQLLAEKSHSALLAEVLQAEGIVAFHRRQYTQAKRLYLASLNLARARGDKELEASDLLNLGNLSLDSERYGEALDWFNTSTQVAQSADAQVILETDLGNVGWAYYKLGDYEGALAKTQQAEEQAQKLGAGLTLVYWRKHASLCRQQLGDLSGAEAEYIQALREAEPSGNKKLISGIQWGLSLVYVQQGRLDSAKVHADESREAAALSGDKLTEMDATLLQGLVAERQGNDSEALRTFTEAYRDSADIPSVRWKIENSIATLMAHGAHPEQAEPWFRRSIATFEAQRSSVKRDELKLPFFANGDQLYRDYADFLIRSDKQDEALHLLDFGRAKSLSDGLESATLATGTLRELTFDPRAVARSQNATILFYSLGDDKSWLWAIDATHIQIFNLPKRSDIEARVNAYQKTILKSNDPIHDNNPDASALYDAIVAPAISMIPQDSKVLVVPDGGLNQLNFETLLVPGKDKPHYWIEDVTITNANAIRLLPRRKPALENSTEEKTLLLIGNPVSGSNPFDTLPHAASEVESIANQFSANDRKVLTQAAAIPAAYVISKPDQYSYIHFVAHGTASRLSPLDSAVVLSAARDHPDDYKLYARDILRQPIHAELVTISACVGSGVRSYAGEGLVGLSWAFLRAGSHHVIGALWNVDDAATPQIMDELYRGLRSGNGPDVALRNAKLLLLHSDGVYRKPLYWAAFQLYAGS